MKDFLESFSELPWWGIGLLALIALGQLAFAYYVMPRMMLVVLGLAILIGSGWLIWKTGQLARQVFAGFRSTKSQVTESQ